MDSLKRAAAVCGANLERLEKQRLSVMQRREGHIRELALSFHNNMPDNEDSAEELRRFYRELADSVKLDIADRIEFCRYAIPEQRYSLVKKLLYISPSKKVCTVSYVRNPLSDLAYEAFATRFDRCYVNYGEDFVSCLEDVYHSVSDYAILPISNDKTGRLKSFCDLADKYELKRVLSTIVYSNTDDSETDFVLFSKNHEILFSQRSGDIRFDISFPPEQIIPILSAAHAYRLKTRLLQTDMGRCSLSFDINEGNIDAMLCFLLLEVPEYSPMGIYKNI